MSPHISPFISMYSPTLCLSEVSLFSPLEYHNCLHGLPSTRLCHLKLLINRAAVVLKQNFSHIELL